MILKEAYRYQNFLTNLISSAQTYLGNGLFIMTTTQKHMKSKANPEATDDNLEVPKSYNVDFTPTQLVDFLMDAIQEKQNISGCCTGCCNDMLGNPADCCICCRLQN